MPPVPRYLYKAPRSIAKSFLVSLPGHVQEFPTGRQNTQGDYTVGFDTPVRLDTGNWKVCLRSVNFNNSFSTHVPKTRMEIVYIIPDVNLDMIEKVSKWPNTQIVDIVPGTKVAQKPLTKIGDENGRIVFLNEAIYTDAEDLISDINEIYREAGVSNKKPLMTLDDNFIVLSLERNKVEDPWILPLFDGEVRKRLGLPQLLSPNMIELLNLTAGHKTTVDLRLKTSIKIIKTRARSLRLFVDCVKSNIPGLEQNEIMRISSDRNMEMSGTNVINFDNPIPLPLASPDITIINVKFKDELGQVVDFPFGSNLVVLEFIKEDNE